MMITLTDSAAKAIKNFIRGSAEPVAGMRIVVSGGGCSGFEYGLKLEAAAADDDTVVEANGLQLFLDPASGPLLEGVTVDFVDSLSGSGFRFENPNAKASCGCGKSFSA